MIGGDGAIGTYPALLKVTLRASSCQAGDSSVAMILVSSLDANF